MSKLLRHYSPGSVYFVTAVTHERVSILTEHVQFFWRSVEKFKADSNFDLIAWVALPDHFHMIIDPLEHNLSSLIRRIKLSFAYQYRQRLDMYQGKVWQRRFWDHIIRDENDMNQHIDYIHYNPLKHGLVSNPFDWKQSSIHKFHKEGYYSREWGVIGSLKFEGEFGE